MKFFRQHQTTILVIILIAGGFWAYQLYFGGNTTLPTTDQSAQMIGNEVLVLKQKLESASFDQSLFSSPLYQSLQDFSYPIPDQPRGRPNPFDIIGRD